ncbi:hypothetical protein LSUE1_G001328 [Lachnellula suecica]|uniref:Uncharacterized protein n=1 Tax=Lachnellula suecica TaxID=602035 RepID=A0A8T9CF68_9HELO|nr:hypothetical protein LSUE1_G001328 [Lachnellula suecica]
MASAESAEDVAARLQAFIKGKQASTKSLPAINEPPPTIVHGQSLLDVPRNHPKVEEIEAALEVGAKFRQCEVLLRGDLKDHLFFGITIHNSSLSNCTLISCTIYGGRIKNSLLRDCRVSEKAIGIYENSSPTPFLSFCQIENGALYDGEIFSSTLTGISSIQSCDIENSLAVHSSSFESTWISCGIHESKLHECEVVDGVLTESVIVSKSAMELRKFPSEIRKIIFSNIVATNGVKTSMIAALRPDLLLYGEILESLFQEHFFILSPHNQDDWISISPSVLKRLTKLAII